MLTKAISLSVFERMALFINLPKIGTVEGDLFRVRAASQLRMVLPFNSEELEEFGIKKIMKDVEGKEVWTGNYKWDKSENKEIEFTESMKKFVIDILKGISDMEKVDERILSLYEKFPDDYFAEKEVAEEQSTKE